MRRWPKGDIVTYRPIEQYGIIGDTRSAALIGLDGSIDWFCCPSFDSPSVFAALLDDERGGRFTLAPDCPEEAITRKQFYWPDTNVLVTRFLAADGVGEITDFMPIGAAHDDGWRQQLIRRVHVVRGRLPFRLRCQPAFDYARTAHETTMTDNGVIFAAPDLCLGLAATLPLTVAAGAAEAAFTLGEGEGATFILRQLDARPGTPADCGLPCDEGEAEELFRQTVAYWRRWVSRCTYTGRWREIVRRSALVLKLLTYSPTGAIVAAPTCGLPEAIGGDRNWDYRYTWIRDSAFTLYGLLRIGFTEEAARFMDWLDERCHEANPDGSLQIVYGIDGRRELPETILDGLAGYRGSGPVRIGNAAAAQMQLDIYGALLDAVYLYNKHGEMISYEFWTHLRRLVDWVCEHWRDEDDGIWEVRSGRQQFVYSKVMCWVAVDRALRLADRRSFPADRVRWAEVRDAIYEEVMERGWNVEQGTFVQAYDGDTLDASALIMPLVFFMAPRDPRMIQTLDAIRRPTRDGGLASDGLVYRYDSERSPDGLDGEEGAFSMCSFWLVEALTRAGRTDRALLEEARLRFEQMLGYANHLGLYAEELGPRGEALGNFPQAFTHLALISAAYNLDRALGIDES
ncbi:MAG TPA: glycoside hydrolase family 15 protein [Thermomicrobiales bacterium]